MSVISDNCKLLRVTVYEIPGFENYGSETIFSFPIKHTFRNTRYEPIGYCETHQYATEEGLHNCLYPHYDNRESNLRLDLPKQPQTKYDARIFSAYYSRGSEHAQNAESKLSFESGNPIREDEAERI